MIDLTPLEVRQKRDDFPRGLRGYDPGHVDDFLNLVAERLEALVKENRRLAEEVESLRAGAGEYRDREKALTEALVSAQQMRESVREQSTREADLVRREAEHEAQRLRDDALLAIEREEETLRRLRARQRQLVEGYRGMLERELRELAVVAASLDAGEAASVPAAVAGVGPVEAGAGSAPGGKAAGGGPGAAGQAGGAKPVEAGTRGEPGSREREGTGAPARPTAASSTAGTAADGGAKPPPVGAKTASEPATAQDAGVAGASAGEDDAERLTPWAVPPPAAPRPAGDRRGHGRDRFASPAASMEGTEPRRGGPDSAARGEDAQPGRAGGDEPDWLAAILKEE